MERIDTAADREPGLASEALRALSDLARDEEPQPAPEPPAPAATPPVDTTTPAEPSLQPEGETKDAPRPAVAQPSRAPGGALLVGAAALVLLCGVLFVVLALS